MGQTRVRILAVDDDGEFLRALADLMQKKYDVTQASCGREALEAIERASFDAVLLDIGFGHGMGGLEVLERIHSLEPDLPVIMVTGDRSSATAVAALRRGAWDYVDKTPDLNDLGCRISRALGERKIFRENEILRQEIALLKGQMIGDGPAMRSLKEEIRLVGQGSSPVLIVGETGTGKELVARSIHGFSRPRGPFVAVNCAAVPKELFESSLFGSERGVFTGADHRIIGFFELAADGVLFLDEITEMDVSLQAKLLRAVEERQFTRLGGRDRIEFGGRVLASSNRDLKNAVQDGVLRQDLYFRLSTYVVKVPALRDRREDIPMLVKYFLERKGLELKKQAPQVDPETLLRLCSYDWPGNVRELESTIEAYVARGRLVMPTVGVQGDADLTEEAVSGLPYNQAREAVLHRFQTNYVRAVLAACAGDVAAAAEKMGLTRFGLQKILKRLGVQGPIPSKNR